jgi:hypothetical protein
MIPRLPRINFPCCTAPTRLLAVWDRRDALLVHLGLAAPLLWWQPFALPIDGSVLFPCTRIPSTGKR